MIQKQIGFRFRPFVSVLTAFSFLVITLSGILLFIAPSGRGANPWTFLGLSKHQWNDLHVCMSAVFVAASIFHICLNLKPLCRYFVDKVNAARRLRLEWIAAFILSALVCWGTIKEAVPFSSLINFGQKVRSSWSSQRPQSMQQGQYRRGFGGGTNAADLGGFGQQTLRQVCQEMGIDINTALETLKQKGIRASSDHTIRRIADENRVRPGDIRQHLESAR